MYVNNIKIDILNNIDDVRRFYREPNVIIDNPTTALFTEEYMHLLHYAGGYTYDEANTIRLALCKKKTIEVEFYRTDFISRTRATLCLGESTILFDNIAKGICYTHSKAAFLSAKLILDDQAFSF